MRREEDVEIHSRESSSLVERGRTRATTRTFWVVRLAGEVERGAEAGRAASMMIWIDED